MREYLYIYKHRIINRQLINEQVLINTKLERFSKLLILETQFYEIKTFKSYNDLSLIFQQITVNISMYHHNYNTRQRTPTTENEFTWNKVENMSEQSKVRNTVFERARARTHTKRTDMYISFSSWSHTEYGNSIYIQQKAVYKFSLFIGVRMCTYVYADWHREYTQ